MKRLLTVLMIAVLGISGLAACNRGGGNAIKLKIWGAPEQEAYIMELVRQFKQANPDKTYNITYGPVAEPDCLGNLSDITTAADVFAFPSDQITQMQRKGYLQEVQVEKDAIIAANSASSILGATFDGKLMAYPVSESNTYFMYYDKSIIPENKTGSIDDVLDTLRTYNTGKAAGDKSSLYFDIGNAYYTVVYFFATGCTVSYELGSDVINSTFGSDNGLKSTNAMVDLVAKKGSELYLESETDALIKLASGNIAAFISGSWNYPAMKLAYGDNLAIAPLPTDNFGGEELQLKPFMGAKYYGVNRFSANKGDAMALARFVTSKAGQIARFNAIKEAPSNLEALETPSIKNDPLVSIVQTQRNFSVSQYNIPDFWSAVGAYGSDIRENQITRANATTKLAELQSKITAAFFED